MKRLLIAVIVVFLISPLAVQACSVTFTGGAGTTDWNTVGNWSPARIPIQTDDVCIPAGKTVTNQPGAGLGTGHIQSLILDGTLTISSSALVLDSTSATSTLNNLTLTAAQGLSGLTIRGSAIFNGNLALSPGQIDGPGTATLNGSVKVTKGPSFLVTAAINNESAIAVTQDGVQLTLGASGFNNDGVIDLQGDAINIFGSGPFQNSSFGSIAKSKGSGTSSFSPGGVFTDVGTVAAQMGTLNFTATGTSTGAFNAAGGATLRFGNVMTLNSGTTVGGSGTIDIVAGGVWDLRAPLTVNTAQLTLDGGAGNVIRGDSDITINSQVTWNGGWLGTSGGSAKVTFTKNVTIATATSHASFRSLDILATVNMNADLNMGAPNATAPTITIEPGATFNIGTDNGIHGQCTINNGGTFAKTGGSQVSVLDYSGTFNTVTSGKPADAMVTVSAGVLDFATSNGGEIGGTWTVSAPATLEFGAGNYALAQGTAFSGSGTTELTVAGTWTVDAAAFVNSSVFDFGAAVGGGTITGAGQLSVNSPTFNWEGGAPSPMQGTGSHLAPGITNISAGTTLTIRSGDKNVIGRAIYNSGVTKIADGSTLSLGGLGETDWNNLAGSTFSFDADGSIRDGGGGTTFINDGTVTKTGGTGTSSISFSGTFDSNAGGTVSANSGTLNLAVSAGTLAGNWAANGTLEFSAGNYSIASGIAFSGSGTLLLTTANWDLTGDISVSTSKFEFDGIGFNGGTISGLGDLTVNSPNFTWTGGWMQGPGATTISAATTLTIKIANPANWPVVSGRTVNAGTTKITDSQRLALGQGAIWNNKNVFSFEADGNISDNAGGATFNNDGTVQKMGGSLSTIAFTGTINNNASGQIVARAGTIILKPSSGTSAGAFTAQGASTRIGFSSGQWTMDDGTTMSGGGAILSQTTWILQADLNVTSATFVVTNGSSIKGGANLTLSSSNITLGGVRAGISQNGQAVGTLIIPNRSSVVKVPTVFGLGLCTFRSSSEHMTINSLGIFDIGNKATALIEQGGQITLDSPPPPNGPSAAIVLAGASSTFLNSGTLTLGTDSGANPMQAIVSSLSPPAGRFDNNGTVFVPGSRTLTLSVGVGAIGGTYAVGGGGVLAFQDGTYSLESHAAMSGAGTISLGGTFQVDDDTTVKPALFQFGPIFGSNGVTGGILHGSAALTLSGSKVSCFGGTVAMTPPGSATLAANTSFIPSGPPVCQLQGGTVNNSGTFQFDTGGIGLGGGTILNNSGTMDFQGSNSISGGGGTATINNSGTVQSSGNNAIQYTGPFNNSGSVSVGSGSGLQFGGASQPVTYTQTGPNSSTSVNGGTLSNSGTFNVNDGAVGGSGTIIGSLNNVGGTLEAGGGGSRSGKLASGTGILNLSGGEKQGPNSTLLLVIAGTTPGSQYDQIDEANSIIGNGTLKFQFASGFTPAPTNTFNIVNFASGSGTVRSVITNSPTCKAVLTPTAKALNVKFTSTNVSVTVNPPSVTLHENQQQQFADTVSNGCGNGVTWKVNESGGGSVDQNGLYSAPARTGTFHVAAISVADPTKFAFSTVTVIAPRNLLAVMPPAAVLQPGKTVSLHANQAVTWSVAEGKTGGRVTAGGTYTAPAKPGLYHVLATSMADPSQHALANIAVVSGKLNAAYVANLDEDAISVFTPITGNRSTAGPLREAASVETGQKPTSLAISSDGKLLLSANASSNDVSAFSVSQADGMLSVLPGASAAAGSQPTGAAFDSSGRWLFVANRASDDVSVFSVSPTGQLTFVRSHAVATGEGLAGIVATPGAPLVFVTAATTNVVHGFTYDATGTLKEVAGSPFESGGAPSAVTTGPEGKFLFVANQDSGDVSVFGVDTKGETLRVVSGSPFPTGKKPVSMAVDITGRYLFVANHDSNDVATFQIDGESGTLTPLGRTHVSAGPSSLAVDPSGQYLYVTSDKAGGVTTFTLDVSKGALAPAGRPAGRVKASSIVLAARPTEPVQ